MTTLNLPDGYAWYRCGECGDPIVMTEVYYAHVKCRGNEFCCPRGHKNMFTETQADILEGKVKRLEDVLVVKSQWVARRDKIIASLKGQLTKAKKRVAR